MWSRNPKYPIPVVSSMRTRHENNKSQKVKVRVKVGQMVEKKCFLCYHVLREEQKLFFQYWPNLLGDRRGERERKSRAQVG